MIYVSFQTNIQVGRWFPPGTPVSSTRKLISSSFHRLDMTLAVAEALNPNTPNQTKDIDCSDCTSVVWGFGIIYLVANVKHEDGTFNIANH